MSKQSHTPGPWKLCHHLQSKEKDNSCRCGWVGDIYGGDGQAVVCTIGPHCPDAVIGADMVPRYVRDAELANARLIAASPCLLEALKLNQRLMANLMAKGNIDWGKTFGIDFGLMNETLVRMDAAVQKAESP
jgi:hypothetical protein